MRFNDDDFDDYDDDDDCFDDSEAEEEEDEAFNEEYYDNLLVKDPFEGVVSEEYVPLLFRDLDYYISEVDRIEKILKLFPGHPVAVEMDVAEHMGMFHEDAIEVEEIEEFENQMRIAEFSKSLWPVRFPFNATKQ
jgi:hypothetical protein